MDTTAATPLRCIVLSTKLLNDSSQRHLYVSIRSISFPTGPSGTLLSYRVPFRQNLKGLTIQIAIFQVYQRVLRFLPVLLTKLLAFSS